MATTGDSPSESVNQPPIIRRNRPGTRTQDVFNWPDQDFNDMETVLAGKWATLRE